MNADDFERRYRSNPDPWAYADSDYERTKYDATLSACGRGPFTAALELGGSVGVFSARLAERCQALTTVDFAPTAVRNARRRLRAHPQVDVRLGAIPDAIPDGPYELVVASEVLYYLDSRALEETLRRIDEVMSARLVLVHWRPPGTERPLTAAYVHARARALPGLATTADRSTADYLLHVLERR